jgi:hypothetical protein
MPIMAINDEELDEGENASSPAEKARLFAIHFRSPFLRLRAIEKADASFARASASLASKTKSDLCPLRGDIPSDSLAKVWLAAFPPCRLQWRDRLRPFTEFLAIADAFHYSPSIGEMQTERNSAACAWESWFRRARAYLRRPSARLLRKAVRATA